MTIALRTLTLRDEPFLWEMLYHALYVPTGQPPFPREIIHQPEISRYVAGWGKPGDEGLVALCEDKPIGAAGLRLLIGENKGYGYVDDATPELSLAVLPEYRGQGIGSLLLAGLLKRAQLRFPGVCLSVTADNPALGLYQRHGFQIVEVNNAVKPRPEYAPFLEVRPVVCRYRSSKVYYVPVVVSPIAI